MIAACLAAFAFITCGSLRAYKQYVGAQQWGRQAALLGKGVPSQDEEVLLPTLDPVDAKRPVVDPPASMPGPESSKKLPCESPENAITLLTLEKAPAKPVPLNTAHGDSGTEKQVDGKPRKGALKRKQGAPSGKASPNPPTPDDSIIENLFDSTANLELELDLVLAEPKEHVALPLTEPMSAKLKYPNERYPPVDIPKMRSNVGS